MKQLLFISSILFVLSITSYGQSISICGYIKDATNLEPLPYASVSNGREGIYANELGYYCFTVKKYAPGDSLVFTMVGYVPFTLFLSPQTPSYQDISLSSNLILPTVEVRAPTAIAPGGSIVAADLAFLYRQPTLGGENDLLKGLTLLPGISSGVEGTANISIRGAEPEQTQLLIDGSPVYNANHLGGFLSAIPPAGIRDITVYKSGVPARLGGRLSGVIDVQMREGSRSKREAELTLGSATLGAALSVPISKKNALQLSGRYAYPALAVDLFSSQDYKKGSYGNKFNFYIHDFIAKYSCQPNSRLITSLTYYQSSDNGLLQEESGYQLFLENYRWSNRMISSRINYDLRNAWLLKSNVYYSNFSYRFDGNEQLIFSRDSIVHFSSNQTLSKIADLGGRFSLSKQINNHLSLELGADWVSHRVASSSSSSLDFSSQLYQQFSNKESGFEQAYYLSYEAEIIPKRLFAQGGIRASSLVGNTNKKKDWSLEPRFNVQYHISKSIRINAGYEVHRQYLHRLQAAGSLLPNEVWVLANLNAPRSVSNQLFLGISSRKEHLEWYIEGFKKEMGQLIQLQFEAGNLYNFSKKWSDVIYRDGRGDVLGLELFLAGQYKRFSGALAYTLSSSDRQFAAINEGQAFPYSYDRRHDGNISISYHPKEKWEFTGLFIYQTGHAVTVPTAIAGGILVFKEVNGFRMPPYHRLDVAITRHWLKKPGKKNSKFLKLSLYNSYNRSNPHELVIKQVRGTLNDPDTGEETEFTSYRVFQLGLFPLIPSLTFGVKWH